jgi:membrane-bound ClpP family serine protease
MIEGEYWKAKSVDENIAVGEEVEILRLNRLTVEVKREKR